MLILVLAGLPGVCTLAADLDTVGVTLLRTVTTNLDGTGIYMGQAEGSFNNNETLWEVNPGVTGVPGEFTWIAGGASTNVFPNAIGGNSPHADLVGYLLYGIPGGVITNAAHVDNYQASSFSQVTIPSLTSISDRVVNLSFTITGITLTMQEGYDSQYDGYADYRSTLFIGAVGDGGPVGTPGTCYDGIGVGAYGGASSVGPTPDNGRAKPDITAPGAATSFSTPLVSGCAAILLQAGLRGDGGSDTNSAADPRTIKALLLNGAIKPADWTNPAPSPLDPRYGTGVLNVFNSYSQLAAGKHSFTASNTIPLGGVHPPQGAVENVNFLYGWDFNSLASSATNDTINHYNFSLGGCESNGSFAATATLVWNRHLYQTGINNLDMFLYATDSGSLIAASTSTVDNVEHVFVGKLSPGGYDLQVLKHGGVMVSPAETYALAFEFFAIPLSIGSSSGNVALTWPIYPAGFRLESNASPTQPTNWSSANVTPIITNNQNLVILNPAAGNNFFRLVRP